MKSKTSFIIGIVLFTIAGIFVTFAMQHPELSFPWSQRVTFMLYGAYVWLLFKFLVDIPVFRKAREKKEKNILSTVGFFVMAIGFLLMEITGDTVNGYTIIRGFIVVGGCDLAIENLGKGMFVKEK